MPFGVGKNLIFLLRSLLAGREFLGRSVMPRPLPHLGDGMARFQVASAAMKDVLVKRRALVETQVRY